MKETIAGVKFIKVRSYGKFNAIKQIYYDSTFGFTMNKNIGEKVGGSEALKEQQRSQSSIKNMGMMKH